METRDAWHVDHTCVYPPSVHFHSLQRPLSKKSITLKVYLWLDFFFSFCCMSLSNASESQKNVASPKEVIFWFKRGKIHCWICRMEDPAFKIRKISIEVCVFTRNDSIRLGQWHSRFNYNATTTCQCFHHLERNILDPTVADINTPRRKVIWLLDVASSHLMPSEHI